MVPLIRIGNLLLMRLHPINIPILISKCHDKLHKIHKYSTRKIVKIKTFLMLLQPMLTNSRIIRSNSNILRKMLHKISRNRPSWLKCSMLQSYASRMRPWKKNWKCWLVSWMTICKTPAKKEHTIRWLSLFQKRHLWMTTDSRQLTLIIILWIRESKPNRRSYSKHRSKSDTTSARLIRWEPSWMGRIIFRK